MTYPHPALRYASKAIKRVDSELRAIARTMLDLMYEAKGIGLAANQVGLPFRLFVMNLNSSPDEGEEFVFINPVMSHPKGNEEKEEGCLSLPGLYGNVIRPPSIRFSAYHLNGEEFSEQIDGLMARCVQHETDHLDGVLFTDRLSTTGKLGARDAMEEFELEFKARRESGQVPTDEEIEKQRARWVDLYC